MSQPAVPDLITDPREDCLIRDRHRCVITQAFDFDEAVSRHKQYADEAKDDEERSLFKGGNHFLHLEAAPVLPHSLAEIGSSPSELVRLQLWARSDSSRAKSTDLVNSKAKSHIRDTESDQEAHAGDPQHIRQWYSKVNQRVRWQTAQCHDPHQKLPSHVWRVRVLLHAA